MSVYLVRMPPYFVDLLNLAVGKIIKPLNLWDIATILFF